MAKRILEIHHVTAIAGEAEQNIAFYANVLGLRLVKITVNFDDPSSYHLYYGDSSGHPGTILTFFVWPGVPSASQNPQGRADRERLVRPSFHSFPCVAGLLRHEGCNSFVHPIPARTTGGYRALPWLNWPPPAVERPLLRGEFAKEMKEQKGMDVKVLARHVIAGIEAGKVEIRHGLASPTC